MRFIFIGLIILHGIIHILGIIKAFNFASIEQLSQNISKSIGILWLASTILFIITAVLFYLDKEYWWIIGTTALIISQTLIILSWQDAKFGTIANVVLILPLLMAYAESRPDSFKNMFRTEVQKGLNRYTSNSILNENDILHLPKIVQKYIINSGAVGEEKVQNFRAKIKGQIKPNFDSDYLDFNSVQYNFFDEPSRIFYIDSKMYGLPFDGLHSYVGPNAVMLIKIASLLKVVDARGKLMNKGETVTMFNDMCLFAPASLIDKNIVWEEIDSLKIKTTFTNQGNTIKAVLFFNENAELIDFSSFDRYESGDGKTYKNYEWTTPISEYKKINGRKIPFSGEAIWHKPEGKYVYIKLVIEEVEYNSQSLRL